MLIELRFCDLPLLEAVVAGPDELARELGLRVPEGWPAFPEAYVHALDMVRRGAVDPQWGTCLFLDRSAGALAGSGGYTGAPSEEGIVEIGYEIAPEFRGRGLATTATNALVRRAFADTRVTAVDAHTLAQVNPSTRVLEKASFKRIATIVHPEDGELWHWRLRRGETRGV